jgi:hypothetical protein
MRNLLDDWQQHGPDVLARVREEDPAAYFKVAFSVIPKDVQVAIEQRSTAPFDGQERARVRKLLDMIDVSAGEIGSGWCLASGI